MGEVRDPGELAALALLTQATYQRHAKAYAERRDKNLFERKWLKRFCEAMPEGGRLLDLGCGSGDPIARYFIERGIGVTGVDFAPAMLALASQSWPEGDWRLGDMRTLALGEVFDGVLGWNSFFHLTADEQRGALPMMAAHVGPRGVMMLTVGPAAGEVSGHVEDSPVYHASLSVREYAVVLQECGLGIVDFAPDDPECNGHTILLAQRGNGQVIIGRVKDA